MDSDALCRLFSITVRTNVLTYKRKIRNPLIAASMYGHADVVRVLLERIDMLRCDKEVGQMAFCYAAPLGYVTIVRMILKQGSIQTGFVVKKARIMKH